MSTDAVNHVASDLNVSGPGGLPDAERLRVRQLAQEFEAMLMTQMLREMRRSVLDEDEEQEGFGADAMLDTADVEMGRYLSRAGGLGLADVLTRAFEHQYAIGSPATTPAHVGPASAESVLIPEAKPIASSLSQPIPGGPDTEDHAGALPPADTPSALSLAIAGAPSLGIAGAPISSPFGWRQDPLTGVPRFHAGVDVPVAYGRDVKAAASGTVVFAGVQGGYGNIVTVDHGDGRQTRYAHLSQELVRAGDVVAAGQILGKSGDSGRTTGPHLHFEVLVNGRPVDPGAPGV